MVTINEYTIKICREIKENLWKKTEKIVQDDIIIDTLRHAKFKFEITTDSFSLNFKYHYRHVIMFIVYITFKQNVYNCHMIYVPLIEYTSPLEVQTTDLHNTGNKDWWFQRGHLHNQEPIQ